MEENMNEKKIVLLVDDDEIHLEMAEIYLKDEYKIIKEMSGSDTIKHLLNKSYKPDLILLDILMPNVTGWEVFNRIKAISFLHSVPIAFLTSLEGEQEKYIAQKIGAADYISKPFTRADLKDRVKKLIEKNNTGYNAAMPGFLKQDSENGLGRGKLDATM
jgi:DNA-binding response OmpR family regulator